MESPALPYDPSSPDVPVKRAHRPRSRSPDDKEQQVYIRFLVSNVAAGCIIGKGGCTITEFQLLSGTRIQLSRNQEFFPGTSERIIMISGVLDDIMKAMELILNKLLSEAEDSNDAESRLKVRLVVPNNSCGAIIGKGGSTIKSFIEDSQAGIKVALLDHNFVGLNDRLITLSGSIEEQLQAIFLILSRLTEDALYLQSIVSPYPYTGVSFSSIHGIPVGYVIPSTSFDTINCGLNCLGSRHPINKGIAPSVTSTRPPAWMPEGQGNSKMIGVADKCIGAVVGLGGRNITEISQATGARIKISSRGDFISGTSDRKVMITGSNEAIQKAEAMIMHKAAPSL